MKRAGNLERKTDADREILLDEYLIKAGKLCPFCKKLDCAGRGVKEDCKLWPRRAQPLPVSANRIGLSNPLDLIRHEQ